MNEFLNGRVKVYFGDCRELLATLPENSVDSCVTDPPYGLGFMGKGWDKFNPSEFQSWCFEWSAELFHCLKPGAHLLAFGGTRTYHRMACAIEDAGFEIRDQIQWLYGSGFPKSHDVSKGIDRKDGRFGWNSPNAGQYGGDGGGIGSRPGNEHRTKSFKIEVESDAARQWQGWGTALKPANEPIVLARKPLSEKTVAANVLKWGTGAINVDGCRIPTDELANKVWNNGTQRVGEGGAESGGHDFHYSNGEVRGNSIGRWPANVIHDGSEEVVAGFPDTGQSGVAVQRNGGGQSIWDSGNNIGARPDAGFADGGSAARFFYSAKADSDDRMGSKHPTVKPVDLMQYLVRLITPKGGTVLDPFAGTGTTGEAAWREGMSAVLIEREAEYKTDIERRMKLCLSGPDERQREAAKAKLKDKPVDHGPLFQKS